MTQEEKVGAVGAGIERRNGGESSRRHGCGDVCGLRRAVAHESNAGGMDLIGQAKQQPTTRERIEPKASHPPWVQSVQLCIGVIGTLLIDYTAQESEGGG